LAAPAAEQARVIALGAGYRLAVSVIEPRRAAGLTQRQFAAKSRIQHAAISGS
jgi:hypothetical protein